MTQCLRLPYDNFSLQCDGETLHYNLPWLHIEAELTEPDKSNILAAIEQLNSGNYFGSSAQDFLAQLSDFPASYLAPRKGDFSASQNNITLPTHDLPGDLLKQVGSSFTIQTWQWDVADIKGISQCSEQTYDPLCIVSYLIGKRLALETLTDPYRKSIEQKLTSLRSVDESLLFEMAGILIRQTHYITSNILRILAIAVDAHPALARLTEHFMDEERGHDKLMARSLESLGYQDPSAIQVLPTTKTLIDLFELAAGHSALAYVSAIGMFEGAFYPDSDPLAELLEKTSRPNSAYGYKAHFKINSEHNHKDEVFEFAAAIPMLNADDAGFGIKLFELISRISQLMDVEINQAIDRRVSGLLLR